MGRAIPVILGTAAAVAVSLAAAATGAADAKMSYGFATAKAASPGHVACATNLPGRRHDALLCAWPSAACGGAGTTRRCYDRRAVVELLAAGVTRRVRPGSDLLLEIDGAYPGQESARQLLGDHATWSHFGFRCSRHRLALTCRIGGHGFTLARGRERTF